jgi:transposase
MPERQMAMLTTLNPGDLTPADHPIRRIRLVVDAVLAELDGEFDAMYASTGRPSVPPEQLLKATVLMAMYSIRSERAFCERLNYDLLFKWFLDLPSDAKAFDATTFSKNRQRLLDHEIADRFFAAVVRQAKLCRYVSSDHFSVDGTLLEAWASHKSFQPKDGPPVPRLPGRNATRLTHERHARPRAPTTTTTTPSTSHRPRRQTSRVDLQHPANRTARDPGRLIVFCTPSAVSLPTTSRPIDAVSLGTHAKTRSGATSVQLA